MASLTPTILLNWRLNFCFNEIIEFGSSLTVTRTYSALELFLIINRDAPVLKAARDIIMQSSPR